MTELPGTGQSAAVDDGRNSRAAEPVTLDLSATLCEPAGEPELVRSRPMDHLPGVTADEPPPRAVERHPVSPPPDDATAVTPGRFGLFPHLFSHPAVAVLTAAVVAAAVVAGVLGYRVRGNAGAEAAGRAALSAARVAAPAVLSYDYRHLDADFATARTHLAGRFADEYAKTTATAVRPTAQKYKAVVKASVAGASVVSATSDRVVVLLFVNQSTTSTKVTGPALDLNRVRMTLQKVDGDWRVSDIDAE